MKNSIPRKIGKFYYSNFWKKYYEILEIHKEGEIWCFTFQWSSGAKWSQKTHEKFMSAKEEII